MSVFIKLTPDFALATDRYQWMIKKRRMVMEKKDGEKTGKRVEQWVAWGCYCHTVEQTAEHFGDYLLRTSNAKSAKELTEIAETINKKMKIKLKELINNE